MLLVKEMLNTWHVATTTESEEVRKKTFRYPGPIFTSGLTSFEKKTSTFRLSATLTVAGQSGRNRNLFLQVRERNPFGYY